jgi:hypothetical protein
MTFGHYNSQENREMENEDLKPGDRVELMVRLSKNDDGFGTVLSVDENAVEVKMDRRRSRRQSS